MQRYVKAIKLVCLLIVSPLLFGCSSLMQPSVPTDNNNEQAAKYNTQLGLAYLKRGDVERAKLKLTKALAQGPDLPEVYTAMAYFQTVTGNLDTAEGYYQKAVLLDPIKGETHNIYGGFLCMESRYQEAEQEYLKAISDPDYAAIGQAYENAGWCALAAKHQSKAVYYFDLAIKNDPKRAPLQKEIQRLRTTELL